MELNFNVKVKAGPRTPAQVGAYYTSVNSKTVTLTNGKTITSAQISKWLQEQLQVALDKLQTPDTT
jgi:hypothetical protein